MTRLSVIVPVYNVEDYLDACLESLEAQDCRDFEAVCVNDGSTDSSRQILARWAGRFGWIRIVDKPNGGLSSARNAGIDAAQGDYVCFLDSDDRLKPQACRRIVEAFDAHGCDALVYGGVALPLAASNPWLEQVLSPRDVTYEGPSEDLLFAPDTRPFAWRCALRRDFASDRGIRFDERVGYGEDQVFLFAVYARAVRTTLISDRLYEYRVTRDGSLMSNVRKDERAMLLEHVRICSFVWEDYAGLGILPAYTRAMLEWACAFVANDAMQLDSEGTNQVLHALGEAVRTHWDESDVAMAGLHGSERKVLLAAMEGKLLGTMERQLLFLPLHRHLYGRLSAVRQVLGLNRGLQ